MAYDTPKERLAYLAFNMLFPDETGRRTADGARNDPRLLSLLEVIDHATDDEVRSIGDIVDDPDLWNENPEEVKDAIIALLVDIVRTGRDHDAATDEVRAAIPVEVIANANPAHAAAPAAMAVEIEKQPPPYGGDYDFDLRNLPDDFDRNEFDTAVTTRYEDRCTEVSDSISGHLAYISGSLVRASYLDPAGPGFADAFTEIFDKAFDEVESLNTRWIARDVYARVAKVISRLKGGGDPTVQEVAAVSDAVIALGPVDDGNFQAKVRSAHTDFVAKTPVYDSLDLPDIVTEDTSRAEVEPNNVRAVGMIYAGGHLEMLIQACDLAAQDWSDGYIPVGESAGQLFDAYVWNARDRLDAAAREIQTDRIGGLDDHLLRFCSATSERDRSQYLSEYLLPTNGDRRRPQPRDAVVRKTARDLLAFASLHGWAYAQFASRRIANHIRECTRIVENAEVQKAYGVQGPWQLVERIHQMAGAPPLNVAKDRALASTGKEIVDLLASKAKAIAASLPGGPLFPPAEERVGLGVAADPAERGRPVFTRSEYSRLLTLVENWLAANGINDKDRVAASQVVDTRGITSLPQLGGPIMGNGFDPNRARDQLMQMVANGQMPDKATIDQLFPIKL